LFFHTETGNGNYDLLADPADIIPATPSNNSACSQEIRKSAAAICFGLDGWTLLVCIIEMAVFQSPSQEETRRGATFF
jgi:hypothetical protein